MAYCAVGSGSSGKLFCVEFTVHIIPPEFLQAD